MNLSRLRYHPESELILYESKSGHDANDPELVDPLEFLARVLIHVPEPNKHLVRFYGAYANRVRSEKIARSDSVKQEEKKEDDVLPRRRALSKRWAELIYRIYEVDPFDLSSMRRTDENHRLHFRAFCHPTHLGSSRAQSSTESSSRALRDRRPLIALLEWTLLVCLEPTKHT